MKNPVYETMTRIKLGSLTIRVWREEPTLSYGPDPEVCAVLLNFKKKGGSFRTAAIFECICSLERISAVEVLDKNGDGSLFYPDWK